MPRAGRAFAPASLRPLRPHWRAPHWRGLAASAAPPGGGDNGGGASAVADGNIVDTELAVEAEKSYIAVRVERERERRGEGGGRGGR